MFLLFFCMHKTAYEVRISDWSSDVCSSDLDADAILSLTATTGPINVDRLHGAAVTLGSAGAATVAHAESDGDFTAIVGSFTTGLNSIITGDAIVIDAPGAVHLGNSSAGSFVSVSGPSIVFNSIPAGADGGPNPPRPAAGAQGTSGGQTKP